MILLVMDQIDPPQLPVYCGLNEGLGYRLGSPVGNYFWEGGIQLMVNWWFGARVVWGPQIGYP